MKELPIDNKSSFVLYYLWSQNDGNDADVMEEEVTRIEEPTVGRPLVASVIFCVKKL